MEIVDIDSSPNEFGSDGGWTNGGSKGSPKKLGSARIDPEIGSPRAANPQTDKRPKNGFPAGISMAKLDINGDGVISEGELRKHIGEFDRQEVQKNFYKRGVVVLLGVLLIFAVMITFLTYGAIEFSKESNVEDDVMISKASGEPVQCSNTDLLVDGYGNLVARSSGASSRRLAEDDGGASANTLGVRRSFQKRELASTLPFSYFKELEWLEIESQTGMFINLCHYYKCIIFHAQL